MHGPRGCYTEYSKSEGEGQISHDIICTWNLKNGTSEDTYKTKLVIENKLMVTSTEIRGRDKMGN